MKDTLSIIKFSEFSVLNEGNNNRFGCGIFQWQNYFKVLKCGKLKIITDILSVILKTKVNIPEN